jgi:hypothetical protein
MAPNRPFVVHPILTAYAIGYQNPDAVYIADQVLPRVPVGGEKFSWTEYSLEEGFAVPDNNVGRTGRVNRIELSGEEKESAVKDFGLEIPIPNSDIDAARNAREKKLSTVDPERQAARRIKSYNMNNREIRVAALIQDPNTYSAGRKQALAGTDRWSDYENSSPIEDIKDAMRSTLVHRPNTAVMGEIVWHYLSSHPEIVNAIRGNLTNKGIVTKEEFARLFGLRRILVGESQINAARPGQVANLQMVWGNSLQLLYINSDAGPDGDVTFGFTAEYGSLVVMRREDGDVGLQGGVIIREGERVKELVVARDVGFQISNAVTV